MEHHHHHHHHTHVSPSDSRQQKIYLFAIILNLLFVFAEAGIGLFGNSLGLLADAGHNLGDVFSLLLALIAVRLAATHGTKRFTYGYRKSSILIAFLNAIILLVAVGGIVVESIDKIRDFFAVNGQQPTVNGELITWTAAIGILINGFTAWMLSRGQHDINSRGAYLHMLADTLVSVGVVISGIIITYTGWSLIDPIISLVIAAVILISTWNLLMESGRMSIDAVPEGTNPDEIHSLISDVDGVSDVHHLHIWAISTSEVALTAHVVIEDKNTMESTVEEIKSLLSSHGISHSTIEIETPLSHCHHHEC